MCVNTHCYILHTHTCSFEMPVKCTHTRVARSCLSYEQYVQNTHFLVLDITELKMLTFDTPD